MAITTLAGAKAGQKPLVFFVKSFASNVTTPLFETWWGQDGNPKAGAYDNTLDGVALTNPVAGQIAFDDPPSDNAYLTRLQANHRQSSVSPDIYLCDRLWHNGNIDPTSTSAQAITSPTWPARDADGSTNGRGILLTLECSTNMGAGTPTVTVSYTNSAGTSGRTGTAIIAPVTASPAQSTYPIELQAGDVGVRSVQSVTLSATWTSGSCHLVATRFLGCLPLLRLNAPNAFDALTGAMPRLFAGSVPYLLGKKITQNSPNTPLTGHVGYAMG